MSGNQPLGKTVACMKSHCDRAFKCVRETYWQDKEARIINIFQTGINSRDAKRNGFARASINASSFQ